jgi:hypothetical protein
VRKIILDQSETEKIKKLFLKQFVFQKTLVAVCECEMKTLGGWEVGG